MQARCKLGPRIEVEDSAADVKRRCSYTGEEQVAEIQAAEGLPASVGRIWWSFPLLAVLSLPPLLWFGHHWTVYGNDTGRYLLAGLQFITGETLEDLNTISEYNGGHGPGLPALVGSLILLFGRDTVAIVWVLRLISLLNPLLAYFLVKRISTPVAGLIAAALVSLLAFNVRSPVAINIDAMQLTFYLLSLLALLGAIKRGGTLLALLSGVLLGIAILTKETAIVDLPLALLAVLLLDWEVRGALWHYLGVALVCLPWWVLVYLPPGRCTWWASCLPGCASRCWQRP